MVNVCKQELVAVKIELPSEYRELGSVQVDLKISQLRICKHNWGGLHKVVIAGAKESHELLYPVFPIQKQALGIRKTWPAFIERGH